MTHRIFLLVLSLALYIGVAQAQSNTSPGDKDNSSEQAEAREDAYRRRMELEGARDQDTFSNTTYNSQTKRELIDKLPRESRDNIREQLTDIIIENGQWEPFDALRKYPYEPSAQAQEDPGLRDQENAAWAEQMEKYHQREARAYEASRPSMPASASQQAGGNPGDQTDQEQGQSQDGAEGEGEQQGENQGEQDESQAEAKQTSSQDSRSSSSASSYDPYQSQQNDDADEISTAGVSESALDFLRARQGQDSSGSSQPPSEEAMEQEMEFSQTAASTGEGATESPPGSQDSQQSSRTEFIIPGTIAIKDLDKLEGLTKPEDENPDNL